MKDLTIDGEPRVVERGLMGTGVLVVDDDLPLLSAAKRTLRSETVWTASEPTEARRLSMDHQPDLAIVDVFLGDADGVELIALLKKDRPDLTIVAYSAQTSDSVAASCLSAGALLFEAKNRSIRDVVRSVEKSLVCLRAECRTGRPTLREEIRQFEERRVREALERHDQNVAAAARELGVGRAFVYRVTRRLT